MKKSLQTRHLVFLSLCVCGGMIAKRVVTPVLNPLTDLIRLPGGGAAAAFSLLFIVLGCSVTDWPFAATLSALVQGALAFALGMTGYQGAFTLLTYTIPGIATDIVRHFTPKGSEIYFFLSCCLGNLLCAVVSNLLVFHLIPHPIALASGGRLLRRSGRNVGASDLPSAGKSRCTLKGGFTDEEKNDRFVCASAGNYHAGGGSPPHES